MPDYFCGTDLEDELLCSLDSCKIFVTVISLMITIEVILYLNPH